MEREVDQPEVPPRETAAETEAPAPESPLAAEVPAPPCAEADAPAPPSVEGEPEQAPSAEAETGPPPEEAAEAVEPPAAFELHPGDLVVECLFTGVEGYLLRPVAAAAGDAAVRLRARSFRVAVLAELLSARVAQRLGLTPVLATGDWCLLAGPAEPNWHEALASVQREIDAWLFQHLQPAGELECFLAGAVSQDGRLPWHDLGEGLRQARLQPLEGALRIGLRWNARAFVAPAGPQIGRCSACAAVTTVCLLGEEALCDSCAHDTELGGRLPAADRAWLAPEGDSDMAVPGLALRFSQDGSDLEFPLDAGKWRLLRRLPADEAAAATRPLDFQQLAGNAQLLGYLRAEVDELDTALESQEGDPQRFADVVQTLNLFFGEHLAGLLENDFQRLFAVYAGIGGGMLLMGPWDQVLEALPRLRREFARVTGNRSTLSAGLALAHPSVPLASAAAEAAERLNEARAAGGDRLVALGEVIDWQHLPALLQRGKVIAAWIGNRTIGGIWLSRLAELHAAGRRSGTSEHWSRKAGLEAHLRDQRIKPGPARAWALRLSRGSPDSDWPWVQFLARYASLLSRSARREAQELLEAEEAPPVAEAPAVKESEDNEPQGTQRNAEVE
jgi:hypothetical protein